MKSYLTFLAGLSCAILIAATSSKISADLTIVDRQEIVIESPQPNGMETKQVVQDVQDLITSFQYKGQTFRNTNTYTTSNATIRIVPSDTRRVR